MRGGALAPVQAATAVNKAVPRYLTGLGTITAANTVTVRSRVDGQLIAIHFQEGQQVKAGDLLAEIDPSQFKVALAQAQGQLAKDKATLANARRDLARYQQLVKTNLVSRQELDTQQSLVSETQGTIKADEAAVASAQLQLDWSRITAPIDGRVGLKQVDIGNQISSGDTTGIVVITQTHPIDLVFTLPESEIATVVQAQKSGKGLVVEAWAFIAGTTPRRWPCATPEPDPLLPRDATSPCPVRPERILAPPLVQSSRGRQSRPAIPAPHSGHPPSAATGADTR